MQQLWPCIIRYLNSACGMPQHPLYWLNFHPTHRKEEGGEAGVGDVTNRQLALKIKSFSCLTRSRTCMERAGYMCEYSVRNTIQQASPYPDSSPSPAPSPTPSTTIAIAGETKATEPVSAPIPMSASCPCRVLLSLIAIPTLIVIPCCPLPSTFPFHCHFLLLGFDFVAWPCNFKSHRQFSQSVPQPENLFGLLFMHLYYTAKKTRI